MMLIMIVTMLPTLAVGAKHGSHHPSWSDPAKITRINKTTLRHEGVLRATSLNELMFYLRTGEIKVLELNSGIGDLSASHRLHKIIKSKGIQVVIKKGSTCSAACSFLILWLDLDKVKSDADLAFQGYAYNPGSKEITQEIKNNLGRWKNENDRRFIEAFTHNGFPKSIPDRLLEKGGKYLEFYSLEQLKEMKKSKKEVKPKGTRQFD